MLDYIRIACIVPAVQVGNSEKNAEEICRLIEKADQKNCDIALFPELSLTGYTCADLFFQKCLQQAALSGIGKVVRCTEQFPSVTVVVGAPLVLSGQLYNCGVVISKGVVRGIVPKTYLPDNRSFHERRWFLRANDLQCSSASSRLLGLADAYDIPVGNDLIFQVGEDAQIAVEICEDLFAPLSPSAVLTSRGAEVVLNLSASPAAVGKWDYCRQLVQNRSALCSCIYAYASAGCMESTQDMVFTGQCLVSENGTLLAENGNKLPAEDILICDADLGKVRAERLNNRSARSAEIGKIAPARSVLCEGNRLRANGDLYPVSKRPFLAEEDQLAQCDSIFRIQSVALAKRMRQLNAKAVVGVSGGLDSTLALLVAVEACGLLGRPHSDVVGICMPCFGTTDRTRNNALELMRVLDVTAQQIDIKDSVLKHFADIGQDPAVCDTTYENAQARERTQVLMDYAGRVGGIVVGTGDLSELALGWCTYNGDHMSMYSVNSGVPKTVIPLVIRAVIKRRPFADAAHILEDVIQTPISPELLPPDAEGRIAQQTEDLVGPYALHDFFLYHILRFGFAPAKIYRIACRAFADEFDCAAVKKWLKVFYKRFFAQQFKRSCMPEGVKVLEVSLSPRGDWQMPSDADADIWLRQAEQL